ncbi:hypothetical protein D083_0404 [Dickeya solani RNS 08.23.3.1.A]|nr:hypothetical protein D083_0404 [Dickeya solani RNS 08.23.3.1.A]
MPPQPSTALECERQRLPEISHKQERVFWAVMTMQPGMMRIFNGIPSVNPASVSHSLT